MVKGEGVAGPKRVHGEDLRFLCDEMLTGLARWLRIAGYDTAIGCAAGAIAIRRTSEFGKPHFAYPRSAAGRNSNSERSDDRP